MKNARRINGTPQHIENIRYMAAIERHNSAIPKQNLPICQYRDIYGICRLMVGETKSKFCGQLCKHYKCAIIHQELNDKKCLCVHFNLQKNKCKIIKRGCNPMYNFTGVCKRYHPYVKNVKSQSYKNPSI